MRQALKYVRSWRGLASIMLLLLFITLPIFSGRFITYLVTYALIFGIFALGYDLFYGYTGLVSFGHSVFFGLGAYAAGMVSVTVFNITNPLALFATSIVSGAVLGLFVGYFSAFTRGIYLALVTFVFAEIFWLLVMADPAGVTLGENGIVGVRPPPVSIGGLSLNLFSGIGLYYLVLAIIIVSYLIIRAVLNSQLGDILKGIAQNEERLLSLGYNTRQYKILAFVLSGVFSAIAGLLIAFLHNTVAPSLVHWLTGAEILLITVLGGAGSLIGPIIGSFVVTFAKFYVSARIGGGNWLYFLGGLYVIVIMFLRGGIFSPRVASFFFPRPGEGKSAQNKRHSD